ncbi:probable LRR receptor-like serine/threonine-protein kinase At5g16900 [Sesamum indicum]|uniref:Probable LRR receptor-like serine/threonine-protein kinase At5g16900 n=1 Tax=Sesamum indicum TaxID=4182 RepID=A0A8M8V6M0_SESIN|nr:probable LRR receptor-like serine/threonine-protein kinase At5g16900 [Sesamum indicum]
MAFNVSLLFAFLLIFLVSANGRSLQTNYTNVRTELERVLSSDYMRVKAVSLATDSYTGKTNYSDVLGLAALCTQYPWLLEDNEDPCLPPKWTWIQCNSDVSPRVIELDLNSKILFGQLPDFSTMDALQIIDLSQNGLSGPIPSFLGTFPDLQELNLAYNLFTGAVPDSLACNDKLKLSVEGNADLLTSTSCSTSDTPSPTANRNTDSSSTGSFRTPATTSRKKSNLPVILGATISAFVVFWIAVGIFAIFRHKARTAAAVAEACAPPGPSNPKDNIPMEEIPMNARPSNMSP